MRAKPEPTPRRLAILLVAAAGFSAPGRAAPQEGAAAPEEEIRPRDKVLLANGKQFVGEVLTPGWETAPTVQLRQGGGVITLRREEIQSIVPRQSAAEVYARKRARVDALTAPAERAAAELALALWCKKPLAVLGGGKPQEDAAIGHLLKAVELQPSLKEAYPHLIALLAARGPIDALPDEEVEREVRIALLARDGGYDEPELAFRTGVLLAQRLHEPERALPYLERVVGLEKAAGSRDANRGHQREARSLLAEIYRQAGTPEKAIALYEGLISGTEGAPENFEPYFELARLYMEKGPGAGFTKARELFARAAAIQPEFVDILACQAAMDYQEGNLAAAEKSLKALLARDKDNVAAAIDQAFIWIRLGRYAQAEARLRSLIAGAAGNEEARIHLGLGSIHEGRGNDAAAAEEYRQAARSDPESPEPRVALALSLLRGGGAAEARGIAQALLQSQNDNLRIYAVCARILGEAELAAGDLDAALAHYLRAAEAGNGSAAVLERAGILLLRRGKLDAGYTFLKRLLELGGEERPEALNALGYYHYTRGENTAADGYFKKVLAATQSRTAKEKEFAARHAAARAYAQRAQELLADLELLEAWSADFGGPDGQTLNGWTEVERYGVQIARQSNQVILSGTQEREADGLTIATLQRPFDAATFARVTMEGRVASGDARLGLRLTGSARSGATAGLVFYRDLDGLLKFQVQSTQGDWAPGQPTDEKDPKSGKLVYAGTTRWPAGDGFHVLEVRRSKEGARRGTGRTSGFDLLLDGEVVAWNVTVGGLGSKTYELGFSAQTDAVDKNYTAFVKSFKVYRDKPRREIRAKR